MITFGRATLLTSDLAAAAAFYRDAFGFVTLFEGRFGDFPLLHVGPGGLTDAGLWVRPAGPGDPVGRQGGTGPFLVLYLGPEDLDATVERCTALGAPPHHTAADDQGRYAHVRDLDGNEIVLAALTGRADHVAYP
ncbi:VOC family protein [Cellulomonas wangsupingiae]|uniref:VOC family protein n=1 Tax=Cellulomonas wangsupingiae TaxID=2968085 RepID=A0ABY5K8W4_9CELL|nr:VOC family protein [Cellulomonas wangsupingiae]MCC2334664.1 VOC family protein [Cellulomonas wangsupingiae]MCM0638616.1 VOC family protein [Cellulomonas wangsupingiae]UUI66375.1 VOC family protein [Cellulomonas wangsupingiae]